MKRVIVCDLDGTISDCQHRQHLAAQKAWDEFQESSLVYLDPPVEIVVDFLAQHNDGFLGSSRLFFLTGRPETLRSVTVKWLYDKCLLSEGSDYHSLIMRPEGDWRKDTELKPDLFEHEIFNVLNKNRPVEDQYTKEDFLFLDDRDIVVEMWRNLGYSCWQTAQGAF